MSESRREGKGESTNLVRMDSNTIPDVHLEVSREVIDVHGVEVRVEPRELAPQDS